MALFEVGKQFPPEEDIERLAKYKRGRKIFENKLWEVYDRAIDVLDKNNSKHAKYLEQLYISIGLMDILCTKPADLLVGDPPRFESGKSDSSPQQRSINSIVEENDLVKQIHEMTVGNGYRGDAFLKVHYNVRQDFSQVPEEYREEIAKIAKPEPIIETVDPKYVFVEFSQGSVKRVNAVNIAIPEFIVSDDGKEEHIFLNVERHVPGAIIYQRFRLEDKGVNSDYVVPIPTFTIVEEVDTGREENVELTGVPDILVVHVPYKTTDDRYYGISGVENLESILAAINERIIQIDYILWRHSDPSVYGPPLDPDQGSAQSWGGNYIELQQNDPVPGYLTWDGNLDAAFRELEFLVGLVFQISETPQWLFGTVLAGPNTGGTGTSHTDSAAIKARFMPILSKVKRIRVYVDRAVRDVLYYAQVLENYANKDNEDFMPYEPVYPVIQWSDGLPKNEKELAEIMNIRTGGKATISVQDAIKRLDDVEDEQAKEAIHRIEKDMAREEGIVDPSIFRQKEESDDDTDPKGDE